MSDFTRNLVRSLFVLLIAGLICGQANCAGSSPTERQAAANLSKIPLSFEANQGQTDPSVQFVSHGKGYSLFLKPGQAFLTLERQSPSLNANPKAGQRDGAS